MLATYRVITAIGVFLALGWVFAETEKFDSWIALAATVAVFLASFLPPVKRRLKAGMVQEVGANGIGVQAGRDAHVTIAQQPKEGKKNA